MRRAAASRSASPQTPRFFREEHVRRRFRGAFAFEVRFFSPPRRRRRVATRRAFATPTPGANATWLLDARRERETRTGLSWTQPRVAPPPPRALPLRAGPFRTTPTLRVRHGLGAHRVSAYALLDGDRRGDASFPDRRALGLFRALALSAQRRLALGLLLRAPHARGRRRGLEATRALELPPRGHREQVTHHPTSCFFDSLRRLVSLTCDKSSMRARHSSSASSVSGEAMASPGCAVRTMVPPQSTGYPRMTGGGARVEMRFAKSKRLKFFYFIDSAERAIV